MEAAYQTARQTRHAIIMGYAIQEKDARARTAIVKKIHAEKAQYATHTLNYVPVLWVLVCVLMVLVRLFVMLFLVVMRMVFVMLVRAVLAVIVMVSRVVV